MFSLRPKGRPETNDCSSRRWRTCLHLEQLEKRTVPAVVVPVFPEVQVNADLTHTAGQSTPSVGVAQDGSFDVAFVQNDTAASTQIVVRRHKSDGTLQDVNPTVVIASGDLGKVSQPKIAVSGNGVFAVAYVGITPGGFRSVFARGFMMHGEPVNDAVHVATTGYDTRDQIEPSIFISSFSSFGFDVSWTDRVSSTNGDIRYRAFGLDGSSQQTEDNAVAATDANEHDSSIEANNGLVVSFTRDGPGGTQDVFVADVRRNNFAIQANTSPGVAGQSSIASAGLGYVVAWTDFTGATNENIKMRRLHRVGVGQGLEAITSQEEIVDVSLGNQYRPQVAGTKDGRFIVSYVDEEKGSPRISFAEFNAVGFLQTVKRLATDHNAMQMNPAIAANQNAAFVMAMDDNTTGQTEPWVRAYKKLAPPFFAVGGAPGTVQIRKDSNGSLVTEFKPYGDQYTDSISVAWGDVNGDGIPDLVTGAQAGNPDVRVYDGKAFLNGTFDPKSPDASWLSQFFGYGMNVNVGANVAVGDVEGNGYADVIVGNTAKISQVLIVSGKRITNQQSFAPLIAFNAYGSFPVGVNVAAGDIDGDGYADIVTGAAAGNPHVKVFSGKGLLALDPTIGPTGVNADTTLLDSFFAYDTNFNVGAYVAVGDTDGGGHPNIITGATIGNPHVKIFSGVGVPRLPGATTPLVSANFFAYDVQFNIGTTVGAADIEGNGIADILTGASRGAPHYRIVKANASGVKPPAVNGIEGIPADLQGGVFVGG